jgi:hypothetical protein
MKRLVTYSWYRRHALLITHILLAVGVLLALGGALYVNQANERLATNTHKAICTLRADLVERRDGGIRFLASHPHGALGFTAAELAKNIDSQTRTIKSLSVADCEVTPP